MNKDVGVFLADVREIGESAREAEALEGEPAGKTPPCVTGVSVPPVVTT
jgi:hypothetical protein